MGNCQLRDTFRAPASGGVFANLAVRKICSDLNIACAENARCAMMTPMDDNDARVPTLLLCCGRLDDRDAAISRLAETATEGHRMAVLRAGVPALPNAATAMGPHIVIRSAPVGCVCCTAGVMFRAALFGLLRSSRPKRLVVDLGSGDYAASLEAELRREALCRVLRLVGRIDLTALLDIRNLDWPVNLTKYVMGE